MKRKEKLLSTIFVIVCFALCFFAYRVYEHYASNKNRIGNNDEEINLGAQVKQDDIGGGSTTKPSSSPSSTPFNCSGLGYSDCISGAGSSYCSWCQGGCKSKSSCATPTPTATAAPSCSSYSQGTDCTKAGCSWDTSYGCIENKVPADGCPAGEGASNSSAGRECKPCDDGYYSAAGEEYCKYCNGKVDDDTKSSCTLCDGANQYVSNGVCTTCVGVLTKGKGDTHYTSCAPCEVTIKAAGKTGPTEKEDGTLAGRYETKNCKVNGQTTVFEISVTGASLSGLGSSTEESNDINITKAPECRDVSITVTATIGKIGSVSNSATIVTGGIWKTGKKRTFEFDKRPTTSEDAANANGWDIWANYSDCQNDTNSDGEKVYVCDSYSYRSCPGDPPIQTLHNYCCASNGLPSLSKYAFPVSGVKTLDCSKYAARNNAPADIEYTLLEDYDKSKCKTPDKVVGECNESSTTPSAKEVQSGECEQEVNMVLEDGVKCANTNDTEINTFYKIDCDKSVTTNFDYGNDGKQDTTRTLYTGEGFAYGISVKTVKTCTFEFYPDDWKKPYNRALKNIENVDPKLKQYAVDNEWQKFETYITNTILKIKGVRQASLLYEWWRKIESLKDVVRAYNSYGKDDVYNEKVEDFTIKTIESGKTLSTKYKFDVVSINTGTFKDTNRVEIKLGVTGLSNPYNHKLTNIDNPRKVVFAPSKVCLNKNTGEIVSPKDDGQCPNGSINGGNRIYVEYSTLTNASKAYSIDIKVAGLGTNDSAVINNMCNVTLLPVTVKYRPIDVSNPFINSEWKKGDNWVNSKFNFTNVIHASTWSEVADKTFNMPAEDIAAIKKSNSVNASSSPYLGLCDRINTNMQDPITQNICKTIK